MMLSQEIVERQTKYCKAIENTLRAMGHATNLDLLKELRLTYPNLSATTIHRATLRLAARGKIAVAPSARDGSLRYDTNLIPHDHFLCSDCGKLVDTDVKAKIVPIIESSIQDCNISGRLTISGVCKECYKGGD